MHTWRDWFCFSLAEKLSFKPITKRSNRNHVITVDSHLKTALSPNICIFYNFTIIIIIAIIIIGHVELVRSKKQIEHIYKANTEHTLYYQ